MILVYKFMISGMGNLMVKTKMHFRWRPSWIFKMAAKIPVLPYYCNSMSHRDMILVSKLMISGMENLMVKTKIYFRQRPSWIFKMAAKGTCVFLLLQF